jgi:hypothetical protein
MKEKRHVPEKATIKHIFCNEVKTIKHKKIAHDDTGKMALRDAEAHERYTSTNE